MQVYDTPTYFDTRIMVVTSLANLRLQTPPSFVGNSLGSTATQTYSLCLVISAEGTTIGTNAGWYLWNAASALADNNSTVIKPASPQAGGNPGRWVMIGSTL